MKLLFGDVTFDGGRRLLLRGGEPVHLSPKAFQLLELLVSRRPDAVSKAEIHEVLWPRTFVSEANLPALVNELRQALSDHAKAPRFVRTVHGFGYAFEGDVREAPDERSRPYRHVLLWGGQELVLHEGPNVVGREEAADVWVGHPSVSREHARITVEGGTALLEDLGSRNGTRLGGERLETPVALQDGDEIRLGGVVLVYRRGAPEVSTAAFP